MRRAMVISNLRRNLKWVSQQLDKSASQDGGWRAHNIMIGCAQVIMECEGSFRDWMSRRPERRGQLQRIQETYVKRRGNKALRDLVELAISELEACFWRPHFSVGALPVSNAGDRPLTEAQRRALSQGRAVRHENHAVPREAFVQSGDPKHVAPDKPVLRAPKPLFFKGFQNGLVTGSALAEMRESRPMPPVRYMQPQSGAMHKTDMSPDDQAAYDEFMQS